MPKLRDKNTMSAECCEIRTHGVPSVIILNRLAVTEASNSISQDVRPKNCRYKLRLSPNSLSAQGHCYAVAIQPARIPTCVFGRQRFQALVRKCAKRCRIGT